MRLCSVIARDFSLIGPERIASSFFTYTSGARDKLGRFDRLRLAFVWVHNECLSSGVVGSSMAGEGNSTKPVGSCGVSKDVAGTLCCFFWGSLESSGA